jgi:hypothetical protein
MVDIVVTYDFLIMFSFAALYDVIGVHIVFLIHEVQVYDSACIVGFLG